MVYSTNPRTSPHTSTKRREGINPLESALKPQLYILITAWYTHSLLEQSHSPRATCPGGESTIYSLSITQYHVHHVGITIIYIYPFTFTSPCFYSKHPITFHWWFHIIVRRRHKHVCLIQRSCKNWFLTTGFSLPWTRCRRSNCTQRPRSRISPACSTSSPAVSPAHQCACLITFVSKYRSVLDGSRTTSSDK